MEQIKEAISAPRVKPRLFIFYFFIKVNVVTEVWDESNMVKSMDFSGNWGLPERSAQEILTQPHVGICM